MQGEPTQTEMGDGIILIEPEMIEHSKALRGASLAASLHVKNNHFLETGTVRTPKKTRT